MWVEYDPKEGKKREAKTALTQRHMQVDLEKETNVSLGLHSCDVLHTHVSECVICIKTLLSHVMCAHRHEVHKVDEQGEGEADRG